MNRALAEEGLAGNWGIGAGAALAELVKDQNLGRDVVTKAQTLIAAASDARLGGASKPAMSIHGSGLHGVTASLILAVMAEEKKVERERLIRGLALAFLLTSYIKEFSGRLSAFCGCAVTAAVGASAGIVYLLSGTREQIGFAVKNMAGDVTGMLCDGANLSCSLKTSTGAAAAIKAALLALNDIVVPHGNGIVDRDVDLTIRNIGRISSPGMVETDKVVLDIMAERRQASQNKS